MKDVVLITVECWRDDYRDPFRERLNLSFSSGIATGHYTRPSLAALLSGQYRGATAARVPSDTLAAILRKAGYETLAVSDSPQTQTLFGFEQGFGSFSLPEADGESALSRGSSLRERLSQSRLVRRIHRRLAPKHATLSDVRDDAATVDTALQMYDYADSPRFLWVHLMGSHRPYGRGDDALPRRVSRKAANASPDAWQSSDTETLAETVARHYRRGLDRVAGHVGELLDGISDDAIVVVCGDHGEELGEHGYFFHGGYRRRVVDELVRVPVAARGLSLPQTVGLIDLPAHLVDAVGVDVPSFWDAQANRSEWLTVAPWHDSATIRLTTPNSQIVFEDASLTGDGARLLAKDRAVQEQLRALGYADVG